MNNIFKGNEVRRRETAGFSFSKGLSALVTAVLLIAISLVVATLFSSWITSLTLEESKTISNKTGGVSACSGSGISIEDVYLDTTTNTSRVNVRNTGRSTEIIVSAQIINKSGVNGSLVTSLPLSIASGDIKLLVFNTSGAVTSCNSFSQVSVATECAYDYYRQAPRNC